MTLLSATQAHVPKLQNSAGICAGEKTAYVDFQWWINGNQHCIDDGTIIPAPVEDLSGSLTTTIDQTYCYDLTTASSYKVWQETPVGSAVVCTLGIYPEYACKGVPILTTHFPRTRPNETCVATIIGPGPEPENDWWPSDDYGPFPFRGYNSAKLSCKCHHPGKKPRAH